MKWKLPCEKKYGGLYVKYLYVRGSDFYIVSCHAVALPQA